MANQQGQKRSASQSPTPTPPPSVRARDGSYVDDEETAYLNDEPSFSWSSFEAEQSEFRSPSRSFTSSPSMFSPVPDYPSIPSPPFSHDDEDSSLNGSIEAALNTFTDSVNFAANTFAFTVKQLFLNGRKQRQVNTASNGTTTSSAAVSTNGHQCSAAEEDNGLNVKATLAAAFSSLANSVGSSTAAFSGSQIFSSNSHHQVNAFNVMSSKLSGGGSSGGSDREQRQVHTAKSSAAGNGTTTNGHQGSAAANAEEECLSLNGDSVFGGGGLLNGNSSTLGNKSTAAADASVADKLGGGGFQDRVNFREKVIKSKKNKCGGGGGGSRGGNSSSSNSSASAGNANTASGGGSGKFALKGLL